MSIQFGRWNLDGQSVNPEYISSTRTLLSPYAPDSIAVCVHSTFFLLHGAFHTTKKAQRERQPLALPSGTYFTWTGRLDNRSDLLKRTKLHPSAESTDLDVVSALYEAGGTESFGHLVGDWSLSALHQNEQRLLLAVDFLGACPLYYLRNDRFIEWSSVVEPLLARSEAKFTLSEKYVAGCLYGFPAADLTPYREIRAVPPGAFVELTRNALNIRKHWEFRPPEVVPGTNNAEYEEAFRHFFTQAVRRRLFSFGPVVSELSGGMDSSSLVCVADRILHAEPSLTPRLDTFSYLDDSEPNWNERPFVNAVEDLRGRPGMHIDVNVPLPFIPNRDRERFPSAPAVGLVPSKPQQIVSEYLESEGFRVVLSGLGGDETTGGVPDGVPELADLLTQTRFATFFRRGLAWSLAARRPFVHLARDVLREFTPKLGASLLQSKLPWLHASLARRNRKNPECRALRVRVRGPLPSFQENLHTLDDLRRQIACAPLEIHPPRERRYPFLDRDLLAFLYQVPREQLVEPGRRRALMRRALKGIVPEMVLERKRKAFVARAPVSSIRTQAEELTAWTTEMIAAEIGAIDLPVFQQALAAALRGDDRYLWRISRTLELESWLRDARTQSVLNLSLSHTSRPPYECPQLGKSKQKGGDAHEIRKAGNLVCG